MLLADRNGLAALGAEAEDVYREVLGDTYPERAQAVALGALSRIGRSDHRSVGVTVAGWIVLRWRAPRPELIAALASCVEDDLFHNGNAVALLAALAGDPDTDLTEPVLCALRRALQKGGSKAALAGLALARRRDPFVGAAVAEWLTAERPPWMPWPFHFGDLVALLVDHAEILLPGLRPHIASQGHHLIDALTAWGPAAAAAAPELSGCLATKDALRAAAALGAIGPRAARVPDTLDVLDALARGKQRPDAYGAPDARRQAHPWPGSQMAGWALWRITGDPDAATAALGRAARVGTEHLNLRLLAELGEHAAVYVDHAYTQLASPGP